MQKRLVFISLGQGQGPKSERMVKDGVENGMWVLLQNCHLATSWMPTLERLVENFPDNTNAAFRLWLTSMPSAAFPVAILQNGVKMTNEPPKGMRANVTRSYLSYPPDFFERSKKVPDFKKLFFGLCYFHALIQERRKFGPLGWNIAYEFTHGDLHCCIRQLHDFLDKYDQVPFKVITFLSGQINYGGRVTDDWDRRTLITLLDACVCPALLDVGYELSPSAVYQTIAVTDQPGYLEYISGWPINAAPEAFGLHDNADITCARAETFQTLGTILSIEPRTASAAGADKDEGVIEAANSILGKVRQPFDVAEFSKNYPTQYEQSLNTVLVQEAIRFNRLLDIIHKSLKDLLKAIKGLVVMSADLEAVLVSLSNNQVPKLWEAKAYPSLKPLAAWVLDLQQRTDFIDSWFKNGLPPTFWLSGFYFPQAFLTGTLQNFARKHQISIDTVSFGFQYLTPEVNTITEGPEDGVYIYGLHIEGARWDSNAKRIDESLPKQLYTEMPVVWLNPVVDRAAPTKGIYISPCYKTLRRAGTLSTTGHSTNYVLSFELPSSQPESHWIKRGVALVLALDF
eukprot:TRINITY_DN60801_c0_g1_i1.p1 TRINITY_DN60801_c0_g1~~TRINITY_DN60801_c0_g1_i1.p1  ORF type:complete len:662 (-),score=42.29 TRINITY_DN60801_c0_g1_i1:160-1866(-)